MKTFANLASLFVLTATLGACGGGEGGGNARPPAGADADGKVRVAPNPADQWTLVPAAEVGMDPALLASAVAKLPDGKVHGISSMLVMRSGKPVLEQYWNGYDKDTLHDLRSTTKSITSMLMGIAIDQRLVANVKDPVITYLGTLYPNASAFKRNPTLQDLLTMRSGLECDDWNPGSPGNEDKMYGNTDWMKFYTNLAAINDPGSVTRYCTGNPVALGRVLAVATKKSVAAFATETLFGPLNIVSARWAEYENGSQTDTGGHMYMRPRDMAKLGQLALQKGMWNGKQIISSAWMEESTAQHTAFGGMSGRNGYGYLWWRGVEQIGTRSYPMFFANGAGGQYIVVVPGLDIVAVFTGENYNNAGTSLPFEMLDKFILPAVKQ